MFVTAFRATRRPVFSTDTMAEYEEGGKTIADIVNDSAAIGGLSATWNIGYCKKSPGSTALSLIAAAASSLIWTTSVGNPRAKNKPAETIRTHRLVEGRYRAFGQQGRGLAARPGFGELREVEAMMRRREPFYEQAAVSDRYRRRSPPRGNRGGNFRNSISILTFGTIGSAGWTTPTFRAQSNDGGVESASFDCATSPDSSATAAFRRDPIDVLSWVLDVAGFAVYTVLAVDPQNFTAGFLVVEILVNAGGTEALFRTRIARPVDFNRNVRVL